MLAEGTSPIKAVAYVFCTCIMYGSFEPCSCACVHMYACTCTHMRARTRADTHTRTHTHKHTMLWDNILEHCKDLSLIVG